MTKDDKVLLTARYVEGDMDSLERYEYELRLERELDLNEHLKDYQEIHKNFHLHLALGKTQQSFFPHNQNHSGRYNPDEPISLLLKPILRWFLAISGGIVVVFLIWAPWNVNLYRTYAFFQKIPVPQKFVGDSVKMHNSIYLYNNGSYLLASHLLAARYAQNPNNIELAYAYANTLLEKDQLDEGRAVLKEVVTSNSDLKFAAYYSMALSYVREQNFGSAKGWLQKIPKSDNNYAAAEELMGKF